MRVPVQERPRRPWSRRILWLVALVLFGFALSWVRDYARDKVARDITAMGGTSSGSFLADLQTLQGTAWPRQRAARAAAPEIPTLTFDVRFKHIKKLAKKRLQALERGYLIQEEGDYVPATVRVRDGDRRTNTKVRLRLKGDFPDHYKGEKWSFRVKTKGEDQILGMRVFSIQHPRTRGYAHEPLFLDYVRRLGVLSPRYRFVRVVVNGRDKGVMALEEHYSKELLESQRRRDSVIVRFDEDLKWRTVQLMGHAVDFSAAYPFVRPFQASRIVADPVRKRQLDSAVGLLRGLIEGKLRASQVFDVNMMAKFLAACEVFGAEHALAWNNMRFYYNPITGLLEPVAFDANLQDYAFQYIATALVSVFRIGDEMSADWLSDPGLRRPFLRELDRLTAAFGADLERLKRHEAEMQSVLHDEFPLIAEIPFGFYALRADRLRRVNEENYRTLPLMPPAYPANLHAFVIDAAEGPRLELYNLVPYELEVLGIQGEPADLKIDARLPLTLPPTKDLTPPPPTILQLGQVPTSIHVTTRIKGYPQQSILKATAYAETATRPVLPEGSAKALATTHPFVRIANGTATIPAGTHDVRTPLILPEGLPLTIEAGTTLRFAAEALLLVRGKCTIPGTAAAPVRLVPIQDPWRGFAVFGDADWAHLEVQHTTGLVLGAWQPTGATMVYEGDVRLRNCRFANNVAEDALNLVRCTFDVEAITVEDTSSDAIDMDYCSGRFVGGTIRRAEGDGVDVSETKIELRGTTFAEIKDKAISIGEQSEAEITGVTITASGTGLASKDNSKAAIADSRMQGIEHVAIMAYTKKPEFGGASVAVRKVTIDGSKREHLAQLGSSMTVDGTTIEPVALDVEALYSTGHMQKRPTKKEN